MRLKLKTKKSHHFVSDEFMMLAKDDVDNGKHDSIERTLHAYLAYKNPLFLTGIRDCLRENGEIKRYPTDYDGMLNISNDHLIYAICAFEYAGDIYTRNIFISQIKNGFKGKPRTTIKMYRWFDALQSNELGKLPFYIWEIGDMIGKLIWNKLIMLFIPNNEEMDPIDFEKKKDTIKRHPLSYLLYPTYALKINSFMLDVLPDSWLKRVSRKVMSPLVPKYNYLLKSMLHTKKKVFYAEVSNYRPMTCDRWSCYLNPSIESRKCSIITDKYSIDNNALDRDLLYVMYNKHLYY